MQVQYLDSIYRAFRTLPPTAALSLATVERIVARPQRVRGNLATLLAGDPRFELLQVQEGAQVKPDVRLSGVGRTQSVPNTGCTAINVQLGVHMTRERMLEDKRGMTVTQFCFDKNRDGEQIVLRRGESLRVQGRITNANPATRATLTAITSVTERGSRNTFLAHRVTGAHTVAPIFEPLMYPLHINGTEIVDIAIEFIANVDVGVVNTMLKFEFKFEFESGGAFFIGRLVTVHIGDTAIKQLLKATTPFTKRRRTTESAESRSRTVVVDGERPPGCDTSRDAFTAPKFFDVPASWKEGCRLGEDKEALTEMRTQFGADNLVDLSHKLLWTEELQMDKDIQMYDMDQTRLDVRGSMLALTVPGLAEKRPSVLKGDHVLVYRTRPSAPAGSTGRSSKAVKYKGYVHRVERDQVLLKFDKRFHHEYVQGQAVSVEFTYTRMVLRVCHQAVDQLTPSMLEYLTPSTAGSTSAAPAPSQPSAPAVAVNIHPVNRNLNEEQMLAVRNVVQHSNRDLHCPYVIFGPPGTGKTSTMVEAILQYAKHHPAARILICAPSNAAADVLLSRLAVSIISTAELFRYNSYQRDPSTVDTKVKAYSKYDDRAEAYQFPGTEIFLKYKFVVCTCIMAGKLFNYGLPRGHFSAAFVDEAGHGWEPEVLAAFSALLDISTRGSSAQLVLAGDPKQLGPIVRSDSVDDDHGGLSISLLERLILSHPAYQRDLVAYPGSVGYDPRALTMLRKCYRCHPDILKIPNELFYNGALDAAADHRVTHNLATWPGLPTQHFPMVFHGVEGENMREANSPSWFNIAEIEIVFKYVRDLVDNFHLPAQDIAVITPYHKQVTKAQQLLRAYGEKYTGVSVGSCEQMQGQERRVIIISTVRSSAEFLDDDKYFNLGFVANPKRFNVAITRAKALVIVVGNPHVLLGDPNWGALLRFCVSRGGYTGCSPPTLPAEGGEAGAGGAAGGAPGSNVGGNGSGGSSSAGNMPPAPPAATAPSGPSVASPVRAPAPAADNGSVDTLGAQLGGLDLQPDTAPSALQAQSSRCPIPVLSQHRDSGARSSTQPSPARPAVATPAVAQDLQPVVAMDADAIADDWEAIEADWSAQEH